MRIAFSSKFSFKGMIVDSQRESYWRQVLPAKMRCDILPAFYLVKNDYFVDSIINIDVGIIMVSTRHEYVQLFH
jgi:hypothetical protein